MNITAYTSADGTAVKFVQKKCILFKKKLKCVIFAKL